MRKKEKPKEATKKRLNEGQGKVERNMINDKTVITNCEKCLSKIKGYRIDQRLRAREQLKELDCKYTATFILLPRKEFLNYSTSFLFSQFFPEQMKKFITLKIRK